MNNDIIGRIKEVFEKTGLSQNDIALKVGTSQSAISAMLNGSRKISIGTMAKISDAFNVDLDWLKTGEERGDDEEASPKVSYSDGVPYYDEFFECGFDELTPSQVRNPDFLVRMPGYDKATLWCNASGASMEPEISNGDLIALQAIPDFSYLPFGDIYGIITTNGMRTIKRLGKSTEPGCYRLIPTNKEYDEQDIPVRLIAAVYRVMGALKTF